MEATIIAAIAKTGQGYRVSTFPGSAFVILPSLITGTPFTSTKRMPSESWLGWSNVARSRTVSGSNTTTSAHIPVLSTPRSAKRMRADGSDVNLRMASSSVNSFSSRTYLRRIRGNVPNERRALRIVADGYPRLAQGQGHVGLVHDEHAHHGERLVLDQDIEHGVDRVLVPQPGDLRDGFPLQRDQLGILHGAHHEGFGPLHQLPFIVPMAGMGFHILADARPHGGVFQTLDHFPVAAIVRPGRDHGREGVERRRISVRVRRHIEARLACRLDVGHDLGHAPPVELSGSLQMPDLDGNISLAPDTESLVQRRNDGIALVADVGGVDAAEFRRFP